MGLRDSPYRSLQWQVRLKLEVYGDRKALGNPYHWDRVEFNLPGSKGYRSVLPWVMKIRADGHLAAENFAYVDDGRATGHSPRLTWAAARAYAAGCSRRGFRMRRGRGHPRRIHRAPGREQSPTLRVVAYWEWSHR